MRLVQLLDMTSLNGMDFSETLMRPEAFLWFFRQLTAGRGLQSSLLLAVFAYTLATYIPHPDL